MVYVNIAKTWNMHQRGYLIAYLFLITGVIISGFSLVKTSSLLVLTGLIALYLFPVMLGVRTQIRPGLAMIYVILTPAIPMLLVIDPVELGLFGHDPYFSLLWLGQIEAGEMSVAFSSGAYPLTYILTSIVSDITILTNHTVAKYIPYISISIPISIFLFSRRYIDTGLALVAAIIASSTRTFLIFETKFVDEILAIALLFILISVISTLSGQRSRVVKFIVAGGLALSHHATTVFYLLFVTILYILPRVVSRINVLLVRFKHESWRISVGDDQPGMSISYIVFIGLLVGALPLYSGDANFAQLVLRNILNSIAGSTTSPSGSVSFSSAGGFLELISTSLVFSLFVFTLYCLWRVIKTRNYNWELGWLLFVCVLGTIYAITLVAGRVVPLDPIRLLMYIVPLLGFLTIKKYSTSTAYRTGGVIIIAVCLIIPNLVAIPGHVLVSDINEKPGLEEGHFTPQQWAASSWASSYSQQPVTDAGEGDLWVAKGNEYYQERYASCDTDIYAVRDPQIMQIDIHLSQLYANGDMTLRSC